MVLQLHRSKLQFFHKYGGEPRSNRFKTCLRLAYRPRLVVARLLALFNPAWKPRAQLYKHLLAELSRI